eukprot:CAMPEP_0172779174 /NCGR_PEP_ID=MMETSP1074-20121228/202287_1 /TAXON_ID=2916 /ORGANISM="Ceratium fusus, Strain PA161109" /LENGTH=231 /DNA_ID=CAMNT_0013616129 /DNA_START=58 /DNA_END=753 /DNA_ORIENTATION=+
MAKYPWGEQPFTMSSIPVCMTFSVIVIGGTLIGTGPDGAVMGFPSPKDLHGVVGVTLGWICMWYTFLGNQITFKIADIDENQKKTAAFIADRGVGNTMEQCIPFFLVLWLHALFVNPGTSSVLGLIYVISRYLYPIFYGWYGQFSNLVEISAQMNYSIIMWLFWAIVYKCMKDSDLHTDLTNIAVIFIPLVVFLAGATILVIFLFGSKPSSTVIANGVAWEAAYKPPLASQ